MKNLFNIKSLSLFALFFIPLNFFSQANDVKKLYSLFEDKKWVDFEKKYSEIVVEHKLSFSQVVKYDGIVNDQKFDVFKKTGSGISLTKNSLKSDSELKEKYREMLILSYMRVLKTIELKDTTNYLTTLELTRNSFFLTILEISKCEEVNLGNVYNNNDLSGLTNRDCAYKKPLDGLAITEQSCLDLMKRCDSLVLEFMNNNKNYKSTDLSVLRKKLNTSTYYSQIDKYIQSKEEDEAIASKDLKTIVQVLNKYPNSTRRSELYVFYDDFFYDYARKQGTIDDYKDYIKNLPKGKYIQQVNSNLEDLYFAKAINSTDVKWIKQVISAYPNNEKVTQLQYKIEELEFSVANQKGDIGLKAFIQAYPNSIFAIKAKEALVESMIQQAINQKEILSLQNIILDNPNHPKIDEMKNIVKDAEIRALKLSTYTGNYYEGKSTYEYYVNAEGNRVLHGKFQFKRDFYEYNQYSSQMNFLDIANFPSVSNPTWESDQHSLTIDMSTFIWFLGGTPCGSFTGIYKHGKKDGIWKYEHYNEHTYNLEVMTLNLKNDSLISATYSITNKKYKLPANCLACNEIKLTIKPYGFEGEFYSANGSDYVTGNYVNGKRDGIWRQYVKYYDPEHDPEAINFDAETFPADITSVYSNGKLVSQKIRNQETGQIVKEYK